MSLSVPDGIAPLIGYRGWAIYPAEAKPRTSATFFGPREGKTYSAAGPLRLWALSAGQRWEPRLAPPATCVRPQSMCEQAPQPGCTCGYWAFNRDSIATHCVKLKRSIAGYYPTVQGARLTAVGKVAMWGTVVRTEYGYRAQYAYPVWIRLVMHRPSLDPGVDVMLALAEYGVPVETCSWGDLIADADFWV